MIKIVDGNPVPYSRAQFKAENPGLLIRKKPSDDFWAEHNIFREVETPQPSPNHIRDGYELVEGQWQTKWRPMTPEEKAARDEARRQSMTVSMRQARLALLAQGLLSQVEAAVSNLSQEAQIEWEYASTVDRLSPWVAQVGEAMGLSDAQLDALFEAAAGL